MRRHLGELTDQEACAMWSACVDAAIEYAEKIDMAGLSEGESHNLYRALEAAIFGEHERAKTSWRRRRS